MAFYEWSNGSIPISERKILRNEDPSLPPLSFLPLVRVCGQAENRGLRYPSTQNESASLPSCERGQYHSRRDGENSAGDCPCSRIEREGHTGCRLKQGI